jgi:hypothetical protein
MVKNFLDFIEKVVRMVVYMYGHGGTLATVQGDCKQKNQKSQIFLKNPKGRNASPIARSHLLQLMVLLHHLAGWALSDWIKFVAICKFLRFIVRTNWQIGRPATKVGPKFGPCHNVTRLFPELQRILVLR